MGDANFFDMTKRLGVGGGVGGGPGPAEIH